MIAMIFEVWPKSENKDDYLETASTLRPLLEKIDGFISIERFESLAEPGKILSLGFFRDEEAVTAWRNTAQHRKAQSIGRSSYFSNYHLRIAEVIRDYDIKDRTQAPADSNIAHRVNQLDSDH